jgi:hypothetical protein
VSGNSPHLILAEACGSYVLPLEAVAGVVAAFADHWAGSFACDVVRDLRGSIDLESPTAEVVRRYMQLVAFIAEEARGDEAPCVMVYSRYVGGVTVRWEGRATIGRWVQLELDPTQAWSSGSVLPPEWRLSWDSGTGRPSHFIQSVWMLPIFQACPPLGGGLVVACNGKLVVASCWSELALLEGEHTDWNRTVLPREWT